MRDAATGSGDSSRRTSNGIPSSRRARSRSTGFRCAPAP